MELLRGGDLRSAFANCPDPPSTRTCLEIVLQLAEGLAHLHSVGIAHCDVKPENTLLAENLDPLGPNLVKIVDFGRAMAFSIGPFGNASGVVPAGTLDYMALEALRGQEHDPRKSDVFSLGVVLFELLLGQRPFVVDGNGDDWFDAHIRLRRQWNGLEEEDRKALEEEAGSGVRSILQSMLQNQWNLRPTMSMIVEKLQVELRTM